MSWSWPATVAPVLHLPPPTPPRSTSRRRRQVVDGWAGHTPDLSCPCGPLRVQVVRSVASDYPHDFVWQHQAQVRRS